MKSPALQNKRVEVLRMAFRARKVFGTFKKRVPGPMLNRERNFFSHSSSRSLVALSLILSMLLFKPAPLYILDEVDAALDLSHTQNIGQMLRAHFKHSQFIVVSLKDGMFNNANVLFKTKFIDGVSTVTRYAQNQPSRDVDGIGTLGRGSKSTVKKKDDKSKRPRMDAVAQPLSPARGQLA